MKVLAIALAAASMLATSAGVQAAKREQVSIKIDTSGVNFADPRSVADFREGLARQIADACNPGDRLNADMSPDFRCREELTESLEPKVRMLVANAMKGKFAYAD